MLPDPEHDESGRSLPLVIDRDNAPGGAVPRQPEPPRRVIVLDYGDGADEDDEDRRPGIIEIDLVAP
jgi:hypothetical protein